MSVDRQRRRRPLAGAASLLLALGLLLAPAGAEAAPPTALAEAAGEVGYTSARAHGLIDPGGEEAFYRFEYIAGPAYDRNVSAGIDPFTGATADGFGRLAPAAGAVAVEAMLGEAGGIEAGVEYHLRLLAEGAEGTAIATAPSFTTPRPLEPIPCLGDNCQVLPPEPRDPALSTTVAGVGNPKVHYVRYGSGHKKAKKHARRHKRKKAKKGGHRSSKGRA
ncbi:MAG TPA: hypothetical protein VMF55_04395 [Solirubrobacterales bacterium]|nr:hypothetical protein [Solirubrobacterales bacterium]